MFFVAIVIKKDIGTYVNGLVLKYIFYVNVITTYVGRYTNNLTLTI